MVIYEAMLVRLGQFVLLSRLYGDILYGYSKVSFTEILNFIAWLNSCLLIYLSGIRGTLGVHGLMTNIGLSQIITGLNHISGLYLRVVEI